MGTYQIPRNVKGESRILNIFSIKALIYTTVTGVVGLIFYSILNALGFFWIGVGVLAFFAGVGFVVGTFKMPEIEALSFTKKVGGENIDDIIKRAILFKLKKNKIYVYAKEEEE